MRLQLPQEDCCSRPQRAPARSPCTQDQLPSFSRRTGNASRGHGLDHMPDNGTWGAVGPGEQVGMAERVVGVVEIVTVDGDDVGRRLRDVLRAGVAEPTADDPVSEVDDLAGP